MARQLAAEEVVELPASGRAAGSGAEPWIGDLSERLCVSNTDTTARTVQKGYVSPTLLFHKPWIGSGELTRKATRSNPDPTQIQSTSTLQLTREA